MAEDKVKALEMRIVELENRLKAVQARPEPQEISAAEVEAYLKVKSVLQPDWGEFCGINDCARCIIRLCNIVCSTQCIQRCIFECTCGPCNCEMWSGGLQSGLSRFSTLGR